jgi:hypothetical protein
MSASAVKEGKHDADQQRECEWNGSDNGEEEERSPSSTEAVGTSENGVGRRGRR